MLKLLRPHWVAMTVSVLLLVGSTALILTQPRLAGRLVDNASTGSGTSGLAALLLTMLVAQLTLEAVGHVALESVGERIVLRLRRDFTDHVVRLPIGWLDRNRMGDLLAQGTNDAGLVRDMPRAVGDVVFGLLTMIGAGAFMLSIDAVTVAAAVAILVVAYVAGNPFLSRIQRASTDRQAALGDYTAGLDRTLGAARTVKLFGAEDREVESIAASASAAYTAGVRIAAATAANLLIIRLGVTVALLAIMIIGGGRVAGGGLAVGEFVSLFAFAVYAIFPITGGFTALATLRTSAGAYQRLNDTLNGLPEGDPPPVAGAAAVESPAQDDAPVVEFEHVSFAYDDGRRILDDVSFTLSGNQITALIGPSGAGKSTVLALLCRFHDPTSGTVRWQGRDVRTIGLRELRARLGLLEQDAPVLHGTIRDNLLIANPDAADTDLWRVLREASVADEIAALPDKLDSPVLERGRSLSGGQRQRLALARALLSRSDLILMDEPTAHLDRANEYDVMNNLLRARGERSLLVVAHRLSTVAHADQILVLRDGRIQATGTHAELLNVAAYRDLIENELAGG